MLCFEDKELEASVLARQSCVAVPLEIYIPVSGEVQITTYSFLADRAQALIDSYGDDLLGDKARRYIASEYKAIAENMGYEHFDHENSVMLEYEISDIRQLNKKFICCNCIKIDSQSELDILCADTGCEIELTGEDDVIFAVVEDGKILSYAGINDIDCGENSLEISVETAPEARGHGYGSAVVTALCEFIIGNGKKVLYKCSAENTASSTLALKCGFELAGTRYSYVCGLK